MKEVRVIFKRLRKEAHIPQYAHGPGEDAGMDLTFAPEDGASVLIYPEEVVALETGLAIALPPGFEGQVRPRSGLALNRRLTVLNAPGTVDPSYRGELKVLLYNAGKVQQWIHPGDRIAQLVIAEYAAANVLVREELPSSERGEGGFGSTGS